MHIVFVCTGNIWRSPMAEAMARSWHSAEGHTFSSAGISATARQPMTTQAIEALAEVGIDGSGHRSQGLDKEIVAAADRIYAMEPLHEAWMRRRFTHERGSISLFDPAGDPVDDPYGLSTAQYRATRDEIAAVLAVRATGWLRDPRGDGL